MDIYKYTKIDESVISKVNIDPKLTSEVIALKRAIGNSSTLENSRQQQVVKQKKTNTKPTLQRQSTRSPALRLRKTLSVNYRQSNLDYLEDYGD